MKNFLIVFPSTLVLRFLLLFLFFYLSSPANPKQNSVIEISFIDGHPRRAEVKAKESLFRNITNNILEMQKQRIFTHLSYNLNQDKFRIPEELREKILQNITISNLIELKGENRFKATAEITENNLNEILTSFSAHQYDLLDKLLEIKVNQSDDSHIGTILKIFDLMITTPNLEYSEDLKDAFKQALDILSSIFIISPKDSVIIQEEIYKGLFLFFIDYGSRLPLNKVEVTVNGDIINSDAEGIARISLRATKPSYNFEYSINTHSILNVFNQKFYQTDLLIELIHQRTANLTGSFKLTTLRSKNFYINNYTDVHIENELQGILKRSGYKIVQNRNQKDILIELQKTVLREEKSFIGSYYLKIHYTITIYDRSGKMISSINTDYAEAFGHSREEVREKIRGLSRDIIINSVETFFQ